MPCHLDRLWPPTWLEFGSVRSRFHTFPYVSIQVRDCGALRLKTVRVFLEMDAKMDSQSDLNLYKSSQKRSLKTRFAQGPQKGPNPTPHKPWKSSSRVGGSTVFTFAPMPEKMRKRLPKAPPRDPKVDQKLKQNRVQQKPQIDTDSLSCFWFPKKPKWSPRQPKSHQKHVQKRPEVRSRTDSTKRFPQDLPKGPFWHVLGCASVFFLPNFEFVLSFLLLTSPALVAI